MKTDITFSYWFMRDNHTFCKPKGKTLKKISKEMVKIAKVNPYGMICSVTVLKDNEEIGKIGNSVHVDKDGNVDIDKWINSLKGKHKFKIPKTETIEILID